MTVGLIWTCGCTTFAPQEEEKMGLQGSAKVK